jgi:hypothetical protein
MSRVPAGELADVSLDDIGVAEDTAREWGFRVLPMWNTKPGVSKGDAAALYRRLGDLAEQRAKFYAEAIADSQREEAEHRTAYASAYNPNDRTHWVNAGQIG